MSLTRDCSHIASNTSQSDKLFRSHMHWGDSRVLAIFACRRRLLLGGLCEVVVEGLRHGGDELKDLLGCLPVAPNMFEPAVFSQTASVRLSVRLHGTNRAAQKPRA